MCLSVWENRLVSDPSSVAQLATAHTTDVDNLISAKLIPPRNMLAQYLY